MPRETSDDIGGGHGPEIGRLVRALQSLIEGTIPELTSKENPGWHAITYRHPDAGYVAGVFPFDDRVDLVFERGAELRDPDGLLEGDHLKQVRYVRLEPAGGFRARRSNGCTTARCAGRRSTAVHVVERVGTTGGRRRLIRVVSKSAAPVRRRCGRAAQAAP